MWFIQIISCYFHLISALRPIPTGRYLATRREFSFNYNIFHCYSNIRDHLVILAIWSAYLIKFLSVDGFICFWKLKIRVALQNRVRSGLCWPLHVWEFNFAKLNIVYIIEDADVKDAVKLKWRGISIHGHIHVTFLPTRTAWVTSEDWVKGCDWWKTSTLLPVDVRVVKNVTCLSSLLC
jgi:hypothetical protein